jgi:hypothetical protein
LRHTNERLLEYQLARCRCRLRLWINDQPRSWHKVTLLQHLISLPFFSQHNCYHALAIRSGNAAVMHDHSMLANLGVRGTCRLSCGERSMISPIGRPESLNLKANLYTASFSVARCRYLRKFRRDIERFLSRPSLCLQGAYAHDIKRLARGVQSSKRESWNKRDVERPPFCQRTCIQNQCRHGRSYKCPSQLRETWCTKVHARCNI